MKVLVQKAANGEALHWGEVQSDSGRLYEFSIFSAHQCDETKEIPVPQRIVTMSDGRKVKTKKKSRTVYVDSTGIEDDRACEWWLKFDNPDIPHVFCRSDHKMAKRLAAVIIVAWEAQC